MSKPSVYDMRAANLPRAHGFMLALLHGLVSNPITRPLIMPTLLSGAGIDRMRKVQVSDEDVPTYMPYHPYETPIKKPSPVVVDKVPQALRNRKANFNFHRVRDYAEAYRKGRFSPVEVAERAIAAIEMGDMGDLPLRAMIAMKREDVLAQARAAEKRIRAKKPLSIFDGVPVVIKDEMDMTPFGTTAGTNFLGKTPARQDATIVARMRAAGAVLLGKTNMHEIGIATNGVNAHWGATRNPYNLAHDTGGSSSGVAGAVAAGFAPVGLGADGGGSIRIPASYCGLVGLMSTRNRISGAGSFPLARSLDHLGPIASSAEDAALMYAVIAGADPRDPDTLNAPPVTLEGLNRPTLTGLTLGIYPEWFNHADPEIVSVCEQMLNQLKKAGAKVKQIELPELDAAYVAHAYTIVSEMAAGLQPYLDQQARLARDSQMPLIMIRSTSPVDYVYAQRIRTRILRHVRAAFEKVDAIITPAVAMTAPLIPQYALPEGESNLTQIIEMLRFATIANLCGLPAISFPAGYSAAGLPIGIQAIGKPWSEADLLRMAYIGETLVERRRPFAYYDLLD
jgi:Asp-tRNA(Asn)/Glu-tRNA(Gln) amidotransferase A subunit family amidase